MNALRYYVLLLCTTMYALRYYVLLLVLHIYGFGSNWDLDLPIWLQPKSIWTDLDPFGLAQKPNVFGNQFVQIRACPNKVQGWPLPL